jgi:signal transduction histidine kinase
MGSGDSSGFTPTIVGKAGPCLLGELDAGGDSESASAGVVGRALLRVLADLVFIVRRDGVVEQFQAPPDAEYPLASEAVVGRKVLELVPEPEGQLAMRHLERVFRTGALQVYSCQHSFHNRTRIFEVRITLCDAGRALALVRDVTDRQLLENEMIENSHRVQMRIGQDLHDSLGQHLTGISFLSRALEKKLAAQSMNEAHDAAEISRLVLAAISQTRHLARGLFPAELENRGLLPALQELAANVEELCRVSCRLECAGAVVVVSPETAMHLFRLAQEAVNNAVKHGKARRIVVRIENAGGRTVLSVEDDGMGISSDRPLSPGLGLRIMNYRVQKIGGTLEIRPREAGGTVVRCAFGGGKPVDTDHQHKPGKK